MPNYVDRIPPQAVDIERQVLGAMLFDGDAIPRAIEILDADSFYRDAHAKIFSAIVSLFDRSEPVDGLTIVEELRKRKELEAVGGASYLAELVAEVATSANVEHHARIVQEKALLRKTIALSSQITTECYEATRDFQDILGGGVGQLLELSSGSIAKDTFISPEQFVDRRVQGLEQRQERAELLTGFPSLDSHLSRGFAKGEFSIIAARPSVGKSSLKSNIIRNFCGGGYSVLSITPQQGFDVECDRMDALMLGIPLLDILRIRSWEKNDPRREKLVENHESIARNWRLYYEEARLIDFSLVVQRLMRMQADGVSPDVVFIDLVDKLSDVNVVQNKPQAINKVLGRVVEAAQRFQTHFCLLVQIRRPGAKMRAVRPNLDELKDSGGYEEDADLVLLLYREGMYDQDVMDDMIEVEIAKQRNGPAGFGTRTSLSWDSETLRITDPEGERTPF